MNQELVEILLSIFQVNGITKSALCSREFRRVCGYRCNVCPFERMYSSFYSSSHYLKHLITLMDRGNI